MKKRWAARPVPRLELSEAPEAHGLPGPVALLLARRGYSGRSLERFLRPDMGELSSWRAPGGMQKAAERIASAVRDGEKILVHGDYDADGITATAVVYLALKRLGARVDYFIPDRFDDGYGLGDSSLEACSGAGASLLITVDCGVSDAENIEALKAMGVETVITDHHQPGETMPDACALVDPALEDEAPWSHLAGAGVAWMAMRGVYEILGGDPDYLRRLLQYVAVGTVADVVDLVEDNRIIVSRGLELLRSAPFPGISALAVSASIDIAKASSTDLAYYIGPRLNACGRIGHAHDAVRLLLAESSREAEELASRVESHNRRRRKLDRQVEAEVVRRAGDLHEPRCILMADGNWHRGVIGIVASRLVSRFGVPSLMIALEDGRGFGSARSVPGIPIHSILKDIQSRLGLMDSLGGHPMAAGFQLPAANVEPLRAELCSVLSRESWDRHLGSVLYLDGRLEGEDLNAATVRALDILEPFGKGNRRPVWLVRGAHPLSWKAVGRQRDHLSCSFRIGSETCRAIGFGLADRQSLLSGKVDLAFTLSMDTWRNDGSIQLLLEDIRRHRRAAR